MKVSIFKVLTIFLVLIVSINLYAAYPFVDDFEYGTGSWTSSGGWGVTTVKSLSPTHALTDSPNFFYTNNTDSAIQLSVSVDLTSASLPALQFYHRYSLENGYDNGVVEVSMDNGVTWELTELASYTGNSTEWSREQLDLSTYSGESILIRFRLVTDGSVVRDGWYIDDVLIDEAPAAPENFSAQSTTPNEVNMAWDLSASANVTSYRIYRGEPGDVDWHDARMVVELSETSTNYTDIAVTPKTTYAYRVMAIADNEMHGISDEAVAVTTAGLDFPFMDDAESATTIWNADSPWDISDDDSFSPSHSWSDSPYANYENIINSSLRVATPLDLTGAADPVFCFIHKYNLISGDSAVVEVSVNANDWTALEQFTGTSDDDWLRQRYDLSEYTNSTTVYVRFRLTTDTSSVTNGWNIDDISVAESPATIPAPVLDQVQSHSMRLTWQASSDDLFSHYAIYRSTASGVGANDTLVANISNQTSTVFTDTFLALDTEYYYRVYAVTTYGAFSADGTESHAHTLNNPLPFSDDFEGNMQEWNLTGIWGLNTTNTHSGEFCLSDSPDSEYSINTESTALTAVDLTGTTWPVLKFWDRVDLNTGDRIRVEISKDGTTWITRYGAYDSDRIYWEQQQIDLFEWAGESNVRIRFHIWTDGGTTTTGDGWNIDDVEVVENPQSEAAIPLYDGFEGSSSNWLSAGWMLQSNNVHNGSGAVKESFAKMTGGTEQMMTLGSEIVLTNLSAPQLVYWLKGAIPYRSTCRWQVYVDGDTQWRDISGSVVGESTIADWTRYQLSLDTYVGDTLKLRYKITQYYDNYAISMAMDDVVVEERPANTIMDVPIPSLKSAQLSWTPSDLGSSFNRYELYRDTSPAVDLSGELVLSTTDVNVTNTTDTGLSIGQTYYYRLFVVNNHDVYSSGNETSTTTVPLNFGFTDSMESMNIWDVYPEGSWGVDISTKHSGSASLGDSPSDSYGINVESYILTAVDLSETTWPILKFWDRIDLNTGDRVRVEISKDGTTWYTRYGSYACDSIEWRQQQIDLFEWAGEDNVRIRFHMWTDGGATTLADGWNIDDVELVENVSSPFSCPFYDGFEVSSSNWLSAGWMPLTNNVHSGSEAMQESFAKMTGGTEHMITLGSEMVMTNLTAPQLVYWLKGAIPYRSTCRWQVYVDGDTQWRDIANTTVGESTISDWTRYQVSLDTYVDKTIKLRYKVSEYYDNYAISMAIDDVVVEERPANVIMGVPIPSLKSAQLSWAPSALGSSFNRYELYRDTSPAVDLSGELVLSTTDVNVTNTTDTGLSIGQTYYYRLFVVNNHDVYSSGNETSTITVPLNFGFTDPMETIDNWDVYPEGSWGVDTSLKHSGNASLGDSPGDNYGINVESYILTAVDLSETTWPILKFWDRIDLNTGDRVRVEISKDGTTWYTRYGSYACDSIQWRQQQIDLFEWAGEDNVRIRFHMWTDGGVTTLADGWNIDDVELVENDKPEVSYPVYEQFDGNVTNWIYAGWMQQSNEFHSADEAMKESFANMPGGVEHMMTFGSELVITNAVYPQLVYWLKGAIPYKASCRWQVYQQGDTQWRDVSGSVVGESTIADWTRYQLSLDTYAGKTIKLRYKVTQYYDNYAISMGIDDIVIEDQTPNAFMNVPVPHLSSIDLNWEPSAIGLSFKRYEIYRDTSSSVSLSDELVLSTTDLNVTNFTDTGLSIGQTYYYKLYVVNDKEVYSSGHEQLASTIPHDLGLVDPMESMSNWYVYGSGWGVDTSTKHSGSSSIGDSPANNYGINVDSYILTAVNLSEATWPVLKFWDQVDLNAGDRVRVEISKDGVNWTTRYGSYASDRLNWQQQQIDLFEWAGEDNVRIRFHFWSDGGTTTLANGWNIDDVEVVENDTSIVSGFYDGFEAGSSDWLASGWTVQTNDVHLGSQSLKEPFSCMTGGTDHMATYGKALSFSNAVDPQLVYWLKGTIPYKASFRWQVYQEGDTQWRDISGTIVGASTIADWTRYQLSLSAYIGKTIKIRYKLNEYYDNYAISMFVDDIGIGEPAPDAPVLNTPANYESVFQRRPTLSVVNAVDYQGDNLDYEFEVYSDSLLSNLVANVPVLSSGDQITFWVVDEDLPDNAQYWWRCRATDGVNIGDWMDIATFYINQSNNPPAMVEVVGPPTDSILHDTSYKLFWYPSSDSDQGDYVVDYEIQIADSSDFSNIVVDDNSIVLSDIPTSLTWVASCTLASLAGSDNLVDNTKYYWRMRARDHWLDYGVWSQENMWFIFGTPPPTVNSFKMNLDGLIVLDWERSGTPVYVEYKEDLMSVEEWSVVAGPIYGTNIVITPLDDKQSGYYRVITTE